MPASPAERAHARVIISRFDQRLVGLWNKLMYQTQEPKDAEAAKVGAEGLWRTKARGGCACEGGYKRGDLVLMVGGEGKER